MNSLQTVKRILHSEVLVEVPIDQMQLDDDLRESYGMDSLGFVELRVQCEEAFGISIPDEAIAAGQLSTLGDVLALVERLSGADHPPATA